MNNFDINTKQKVIIAEDDPITSLLLSSTLKKWGLNVITFDNGAEAFKAINKIKTPHVILLDWLMPGMDGIEVVKKLKEQNDKSVHYIIMLTSKNKKEDIVYALDAGADDFISKPFDNDELKARITVGLRLIALHNELQKALNNANKLANFIANYDQTTGLPNRVFFTKHIEKIIEKGASAYLLLINIDRFKLINQAKGLDIGDLLLNFFAARLTSFYNDDAVVARIAADEFGILKQVATTNISCKKILELAYNDCYKLHKQMEKKFLIDKGINLTISIGATSVSGEITYQAEEFIRRADTALRKAKVFGGNRTVIFDQKMEEEIKFKYKIEKDLSLGIEKDELQFFLQAQIDSNGNFIGAEALVRWQHPVHGLMNPGVFIPIAEESGLIVGIGNWMLDKACNFISEYSDADFSISVNISPIQFNRPEFVEEVLSISKLTKNCRKRLILEVTENLLIDEIEDVIHKMNQLANEGIRFSIDDFGTGYSSLAYLQKLPISEIKIDRTFIRDIPSNKSNVAIVKAIYSISKALNVDVIAEGVETQKQADFLNSIGISKYQGFLYSKPAPAEQVISYWLERRNAA